MASLLSTVRCVLSIVVQTNWLLLNEQDSMINRYCPGFLFQGIFKISFAKTFYKIIIRIISKGKNFTSSGVPETEGAYMHPWAQAFPQHQVLSLGAATGYQQFYRFYCVICVSNDLIMNQIYKGQYTEHIKYHLSPSMSPKIPKQWPKLECIYGKCLQQWNATKYSFQLPVLKL